jgi:outer membrane biosynthesis protein TonB
MARRLLHCTTAAALAILLAACSDPPSAAPASDTASPSHAASERAGAAPCRNPGAGPEPDARGIRNLVRGNLGAVRDCYDRALKRNPALAGKAVLRFTVGVCGQVADVEVASRAGNVADAATCVARLARGWRTPFRPAEPVAVEYPLAFSAM